MSFSESQEQNLKLILKVQSDAYNEAINRINNDVNEMKKYYEKRLNDLQYSLEFTQKENEDFKQELKSLKKENNELTKNLNCCTGEIHAFEQQIKVLNDKIDNMDDKQRKDNLIISGLNEDMNENNEQCHKKTVKFIREKLNVPEINIAAAHRIGKYKSQDKNRDVLVKFRTHDERDMVFRKKVNLKGQNIFIKEDFCKETLDIRKNLLPKLKEARNEGKVAFIKYRELVIKPEKFKRFHSKTDDVTTSTATKVQDAVQRIEDAETPDVSSLPSPRILTTPSTPKQSTDTNRSYQLRQNQQIKYSK